MASIKRLGGTTKVSWLVKWADRPWHMAKRRFPTKREAEDFVAALPPRRAPARKGSR